MVTRSTGVFVPLDRAMIRKVPMSLGLSNRMRVLLGRANVSCL